MNRPQVVDEQMEATSQNCPFARSVETAVRPSPYCAAHMKTFLLTWNPDGAGWAAADYNRAVDALGAGRPIKARRWSVAIRKSGISEGDRAFLMRQHHERGIIASGRFATGKIYEDDDWREPGKLTRYADINWDTLLPVGDVLTVEKLKTQVPGVHWDRLEGSGVMARSPSGAQLNRLWDRHVSATPYRAPGEVVPGAYKEGNIVKVAVNRYERDRKARAACLAHHGTTCVVCRFNFEDAYGVIGRNFIHVHHLREISTLGPDYKIDPLTELIPLCANCHNMVHRRKPAFTPPELRRKLKK